MPQPPNKKPPTRNAYRAGDGQNLTPGQKKVLARRMAQRRQERRRRVIINRIIFGAVVVVILTIIVVLVISFVRGRNKEPDAPASSLPSSSTVSNPASSEPEPESLPAPAVVIPPAEGEYDEEGIPLLCNAWNPLPEGYRVDTVSVGARPETGAAQTMETRAAAAFLAMQAAAAGDGITLSPHSGYRSHQHQVSNYTASIQNYVGQGHSNEEATRLTRQYYAIPGTSEHEAGLAMDINSIDESFENTAAFGWLQEHCAEYGFILRYEKDTEPITGIAYEPWHYRYVGANHAKKVQELGMTLEEYVAYLGGTVNESVDEIDYPEYMKAYVE